MPPRHPDPIAPVVRYRIPAAIGERLPILTARYGPAGDRRAWLREFAQLNPGLGVTADTVEYTGDALRDVDIALPLPDEIRHASWERWPVTTTSLTEECRLINRDPYRFGEPELHPIDVWLNPLNAKFRINRIMALAPAFQPPAGSPPPYLDPFLHIDVGTQQYPSFASLAGLFASSGQHPPRLLEVPLQPGLDIYIPHSRHLVTDVAVGMFTPETGVTSHVEVMPEWVEELLYEHIEPIRRKTHALREKTGAYQRAAARSLGTVQSLSSIHVALSALTSYWEGADPTPRLTTPSDHPSGRLAALRERVRTTQRQAEEAYRGTAFADYVPHGRAAFARLARELLEALHSPRFGALTRQLLTVHRPMFYNLDGEELSVWTLVDRTNVEARDALIAVPPPVCDVAETVLRASGAAADGIGSANGDPTRAANGTSLEVLLSLARSEVEGALHHQSIDTAPVVTTIAGAMVDLPFRTPESAFAILEHAGWWQLAHPHGTPDQVVEHLLDKLKDLGLCDRALPIGRRTLNMMATEVAENLRRGSDTASAAERSLSSLRAGAAGRLLVLFSAAAVAYGLIAEPEAEHSRDFWLGFTANAAFTGQMAVLTHITDGLRTSAPALRAVSNIAPIGGLDAGVAFHAIRNVAGWRVVANTFGVVGGVAAAVQGAFQFKSDDGFVFLTHDAAVIVGGVASALPAGVGLAHALGAGSLGAMEAPIMVALPWIGVVAGAVVVGTELMTAYQADQQPARRVLRQLARNTAVRFADDPVFAGGEVAEAIERFDEALADSHTVMPEIWMPTEHGLKVNALLLNGRFPAVLVNRLFYWAPENTPPSEG